MPRYAIDTIQSSTPTVIIKVVFFGYEYQSKWMTTDDGRHTVPNTTLKKVVVEQLKAKGTLDESLFAEYVSRGEQRLVERFIKKEKPDGASQRAHQLMSDIYNALRAIIVADKLTGSLRVQCLNKGNVIATYDAEQQTVNLEGLSWNAAAAFPSTTPPTTPPPTSDESGTTTTSGKTTPGGGQTTTSGKDKPSTPGGTKRTLGQTGATRSGSNGQRQKSGGGTARTFGSTTDRETGALAPKNPFVRWWNKHRFAVYSFLFFFVLSSAIVYGLLRLQKSIESLPDQPRQPRPTLITDSVASRDSLAAVPAPAPSADSVAKPPTPPVH
ncbi:MAG: hypothetical protein IKQ03_10505 [Prevotella sp.]|nr:hypothetical protein [Prevotella sp.]